MAYTRNILAAIASQFDTIQRIDSGAFKPALHEPNELRAMCVERIELMCADLPSGSGIDCGTKFDFDRSKPERLVFIVEFHHMDDNGYYDGWTKHDVIVTASLVYDRVIKVTGRNKRDIKDYLADVYRCAFTAQTEI